MLRVGYGSSFSVRFSFYKKNNQTEFFFKNQNRTETGSNRPVSVQFGFLGQKPVQTGLTRFSEFWLGFFSGFGSVWFGFFSFLLIKPKPNRTEPAGFFKILIGFFYGSVFRLFFSDFLGLIGFFAHP